VDGSVRPTIAPPAVAKVESVKTPASRKKLRLADLRLLCDLCRCFAIWLFGYLKYAARWRAERPAKKKPRYQGGGAQ
jgi:hypothetical protein